MLDIILICVILVYNTASVIENLKHFHFISVLYLVSLQKSNPASTPQSPYPTHGIGYVQEVFMIRPTKVFACSYRRYDGWTWNLTAADEAAAREQLIDRIVQREAIYDRRTGEAVYSLSREAAAGLVTSVVEVAL